MVTASPQVAPSISIHAPREGCDASNYLQEALEKFQSTHPVRGATWSWADHSLVAAISIHAPREGCDQEAHAHRVVIRISIHAPREGCDSAIFCGGSSGSEFQSTHPVRGAT